MSSLGNNGRNSNGGSGIRPNAYPSSHATSFADSLKNILIFLTWKAFLYGYGVFTWFLFIIMAMRAGTFFDTYSEQSKNKDAIARDKFWNLTKEPVSGFSHSFHRLRNGFQFHYLCNRPQPETAKDLVILLHGFPNTSMTFRFLLREPDLPVDRATIVVVDMPGFGGSDSLDKYDTHVLELLTEFIVAIREKYEMDANSAGNTIIFGHDWGCVVAMRLATEAPCLADRWVLSNGPLIPLSRANVERAIHSARRIFRQFRASPRQNFGCLGKSFQAIKPLLIQLLRSGYIFVFQLPAFMVKTLAEGGNLSFLRGAYRFEHSSVQSKSEFDLHETMGANLGPSVVECKTETEDGSRYGLSVAQRVQSIGEIIWQTTAYYRDGLASDPWEKSIETIAALYNIDTDLSSSASPSRRRSSSASSALFSDQVQGSLRAPATVIWAEDDHALTRAMCLDGMGDYLAKESEIILIPEGGHWTQVDPKSRLILANVLNVFANGGTRNIPSYIIKDVQQIDPKTTLLAKK